MATSIPIATGRRDDYEWLATQQVLTLDVATFHPARHLCITSCDSLCIVPSEEELRVGWRLCGRTMVSPPLVHDLEIPCDQYDEWYIMRTPDFPQSGLEVFVNLGGFTLVVPGEIHKISDATRDKHGQDYLGQLQERFWAQIERLQPESYIASGDNDIVVSRNRAFMEHVIDVAQRRD